MTRRQLAPWLVLVALVAHSPSPVTAAESQLLVGTAKRSLTPPGPVPLAGYSRRHGAPSTGVHDPVFVRALVLRDRDTTVALASCDLLIVDERLYQAVKQHVEAASPSPMSLLIAATHTHSGPGAYGHKFLEKISMGHFDPAVFHFLATQIAQAILDASQQLQPVTARYAAADTTGLVVNRMQSGGPVDAQVRVVWFEDTGRKPVAMLVNFSAHPTTLGAWNMALSADYPGVVARAIEEHYPGARCLFFAGTVGDQGPVKQGERFNAPEWLGKQLAAQAVALVEASGTDAGGPLRVAQRVQPLPPARLRVGPVSVPSWLAGSLVEDDATLSVLALGRIAIFGLPCDASSELGRALMQHARAAGYQPVVVGFANDYIGYCLPQRLYETRSYEASMAFNGPKTGELLIEKLQQMMDQLTEGRKQ